MPFGSVVTGTPSGGAIVQFTDAATQDVMVRIEFGSGATATQQDVDNIIQHIIDTLSADPALVFLDAKRDVAAYQEITPTP